MQLLLRRGANASQSNLRGKTPVDVAATDLIARLLRGDDDDNDDGRRHRTTTMVMSSDDSNESSTASPSNSLGDCTSPRLTPAAPAADTSSYPHLLRLLLFKLAFHGADADILARIVARMAAYRSARHRNYFNRSCQTCRRGSLRGCRVRVGVGVGVVEFQLYHT